MLGSLPEWLIRKSNDRHCNLFTGRKAKWGPRLVNLRKTPFLIHSFFYKNKVYKNIEAQNC